TGRAENGVIEKGSWPSFLPLSPTICARGVPANVAPLTGPNRVGLDGTSLGSRPASSAESVTMPSEVPGSERSSVFRAMMASLFLGSGSFAPGQLPDEGAAFLVAGLDLGGLTFAGNAIAVLLAVGVAVGETL